jgi:hypothetical protein
MSKFGLLIHLSNFDGYMIVKDNTISQIYFNYSDSCQS